jgi:predicted HicB family RNase H-like nuclease
MSKEQQKRKRGRPRKADGVQPKAKPKPSKVVMTLRINLDLFPGIDAMAKRRGVSCTAWIMMVVSRAVEEGL